MIFAKFLTMKRQNFDPLILLGKENWTSDEDDSHQFPWEN